MPAPGKARAFCNRLRTHLPLHFRSPRLCGAARPSSPVPASEQRPPGNKGFSPLILCSDPQDDPSLGHHLGFTSAGAPRFLLRSVTFTLPARSSLSHVCPLTNFTSLLRAQVSHCFSKKRPPWPPQDELSSPLIATGTGGRLVFFPSTLLAPMPNSPWHSVPKPGTKPCSVNTC